MAKLKMEEKFEKNRVLPGDPMYEYDKQVSYTWRGNLHSGGMFDQISRFSCNFSLRLSLPLRLRTMSGTIAVMRPGSKKWRGHPQIMP